MASRGKFSSKLGFIAAAAGSAVGLGNIWKFPYEVGENGGAAFLIIYLFCAFVICMPIMIAEVAMGRKTQLNPFGAFKKLGGKNWGLVGLMGVICGVMILSFYNVVAGWAFGYFLEIGFGGLLSDGREAARIAVETTPGLDSSTALNNHFGSHFGTFVANWKTNIGFAAMFMILTAVIAMGGVQKGIERATKILMPALLLIMLALIAYGLTLPNAMEGIAYYLKPDFSQINGQTIYTALGQSFFSLSLGMGALITYGSYFSKSDNIVQSSVLVTVADLSVAFLAGLMVIPMVFSTGGAVSAGPGLVFVTLPGVFESMGAAGPFIGASFFLLLCFAALTSTVSLLEVPVAFVSDQFKLNRKKVVIGLAVLIFLIGLPSLLSQGASDFFSSFMSYGVKNAAGSNSKDFLTVINDIFSETGLLVGGFLISIFVAYKWRMNNFHNELSVGNDNYMQSLAKKWLNVMLMYISPLVVFVVLVVNVLERFFAVQLF